MRRVRKGGRLHFVANGATVMLNKEAGRSQRVDRKKFGVADL